MNDQPQLSNFMKNDLKKNIVLDIIFTVLTFGLFNIWVNYRQINSLNILLGFQKYKFLKWLFLSIITFGIYHLYHEFIMTKDVSLLLKRPNPEQDGVIAIFLSIFGGSIVIDAFQQYLINKYLGDRDYL
jgi:hypothetical protein